MEILCVVIHLVVVGKSVSFHFGSLIQTLPPSVPEDFKMKILEMYSQHPEVFGDSVIKGKLHIMKIHKSKKVPQALGQDTVSAKESTTPKPGVQTTTPMFQMQMQMLPMSVPLPLPMYPQIPQIVPMQSYFEPVIHDHPPLDEIRRIIKEDEERWEHTNKVNKEKNDNRHHTDSDTESTESSEEQSYNYYDDVIKIRGN